MSTVVALILAITPAFATSDSLKFDVPKLCEWQNQNNAMDIKECTKLEEEAKASIPKLEEQADDAREAECVTEAQNYSGDSGFASYTVYAGCLENGPGAL